MTPNPAQHAAAPGARRWTGAPGASVPRLAASLRYRLQLGATAALMAASVAGVSSDGAAVTIAACATLLVFGLPHGSFDMLLISEAGGGAWRARAAVLALYLGLAAAMMALWLVAPAAALVLFLMIAVAHFAEDWHPGSSFIAQGVALALIAAPTFLHAPAIVALLGVVTSPAIGAVAAAALMMVAPVATIVAVVGLAMIWRTGARERAISGALALGGMVVLPPLIGFTLFFCLLHSPLHFAEARRDARRDDWRRWGPVVVPVTLAALGLAAGVYLIGSQTAFAPGMVQASFRTLSILTLPHVLAPAVMRWRSRLR